MPARTPAWKAWPVRPPAPSTNPMEDIGSFWSRRVLRRCSFGHLATEVLGGEARVDGDEQSFGFRRDHAVDPELAPAHDPSALHPVDAAVELDRPVQWRRLQVPHGEPAGHA